MRTLAKATAHEYALNGNHFVATLNDESKGFIDTGIQSEFENAHGPNGRENSWGVCQIDLDYHPEVTKEEANDPAFCIPWTAREWQQGRASLWSSWKKLDSRYHDDTWPESG